MLAGEYTDLRGRPNSLESDDRVRTDRCSKCFQKYFAVLVASDDPDQNRAPAESRDIRGCICRRTGAGLSFVMPDDENRGLAGHASDRTVQKLIGHEIADDHYPPAREFSDLVRSCHNDDSKAERPKAVNAFGPRLVKSLRSVSVVSGYWIVAISTPVHSVELAVGTP